MRVLLKDRITQEALEHAVPKGIIFVDDLSKANAVYTHFTNVSDSESIDFVLCPCTGVAHLDNIPREKLIYLDDKEFLYENVWSSAQHTLALMHICCIKADNNGYTRELRGATVGLIGYGRMAKRVHYLLKSYETKVLTFDKDNTIDALHRIANECDIISCHLAENKDTKDFINSKFFGLCKKKPIFINTSRSSVVNGESLILASLQGKIASFGIDVYEDYNPKVLKILSTFENSIITKHIGGRGYQSRVATDKYVIDKLIERSKI